MSARDCPACQRELPEATLRALEQGTACPHCATRLKRTPRRAPAASPGDNDQAGFEVSPTPLVSPQPSDEDSYRWFQTKGPAGSAAPAAATSLPKARSLFPLPVAGGAPGPSPAVSGTPAPGPLRPAPAPVRPEPAPVRPAQAPAVKSAAPAAVSLDLPSPAAPVEPRRAPTLIGSAPPAVAKPSPSAPPPAPAAAAQAPIARSAPAATPPAAKPSPPAAPVQAPIVRPVQAEPPRAALAMTAVLPTSGSTLALAAPAMGLTLRSRRSLALAGGTALVTALVAIVVFHRSADRRVSIAGNPPAMAQPVGDSTPRAALQDTSPASPTIQPSGPGDLGRDAAGTATAATHVKVGTTHRATAHQRRYAKTGKRGKHARHEKRNTRQKEVASRAAPSAGDDGEARASYERGNALLFAGDARGAVAAYRKAVELAPADPIGYRGLGLAYEQQGATEAAIRALRKYLKLAPGAADREIITRRIARLGQAAGRR